MIAVNPDWKPACSLELLQLRAQLLQNIRQFFAQKSVLEVETPILCQVVGTDPNLNFFKTNLHWPPQNPQFYLQTSPEFAMKRLLAWGSGSIFQICKAFRNGESGRFHNPEFTMLEWYRVGSDLRQLMDEAAELMNLLFGDKLSGIKRISYQALFSQCTGLDCLTFNRRAYSEAAKNCGFHEATVICGGNHALWLDFLFSHIVQPSLGGDILYMIYGYPACFSSLAKVNSDNPLLTDRVELFINGVELGNGYYELGDVIEQDQRFEKEITLRRQQNMEPVVKDERLLAALTAGLPDCAGIAIGLDRVLMLLTGRSAIQDVIAFPIDRA